MKRSAIIFLVLWSLLTVMVLPAAADTGNVTWILVPENPEYKTYMADLAAGKKVSPVMPQRVDFNALKNLRNLQQGIPTTVPFGIQSFNPPAQYDLRALGRVTPSKISNCGACWTSAAMGSLESYLAPGEIWDFSEDQMQLNHDWDYPVCGAGAHAGVAMNFLVAWHGPVKETDFDYTSASPQNPVVRKHVQKVIMLPERKDPLDNSWIKFFLMYYGGIYTNASRSYGYNPDLHTYYNPVVGSGHAVTIVGWDDNFDRNKFFYNHPAATEDQKVPPGNGAFIVKDNQGPNWGDNGYYYVSYYDKAHGSMLTVFTAEPTSNYNRIYQYDPLGVTSSIVIPKTTGGATYAANVFRAAADDDLAAVGFFNLDENYGLGGNVKYTIKVYLYPVSGHIYYSRIKPAAVVEIAMPLPGYYTVKLPKKVPLKKGQKFSVVLAGLVENGNWGASVAIERPFYGYSAATANPGESFVSSDGVSWQDVTKFKVYNTQTQVWEPLVNTNVCIKAFTTKKAPVNAININKNNSKSNSPLHVVSTTPLNNAPLGNPVKLIRVTFDRPIKPGPGFNDVTVISAGALPELKMTFNSIGGNIMQIALASHINVSQGIGTNKTVWHVILPHNAVTDMDGNALDQDYQWSFSSGGAFVF